MFLLADVLFLDGGVQLGVDVGEGMVFGELGFSSR
jgi:hypothetical protein